MDGGTSSNVTAHQTSDWIVQQLPEALPLPCRYQVRRRCIKFSEGQRYQAHSHKHPQSIAKRSGVAERSVGSCPRKMLDSVIPLNEQHLRRLGRDYLAYHHKDRTYIGLEKGTPGQRPTGCARPNSMSLCRNL